ncbi:MltA domain-containing protein [Phenylobacterium sp. LjRoot219]|uniref:MltA domain-containing protein n=1 Tax=Phenylobacterium sp. LjRoot219 TaxID=3342283 RepID=UPI003ECC32E1
MNLRLVAAALAALSLAACATTPTAPPPGPSPVPLPPPLQPAERILPLSALPGWVADDHASAFAAFRATCGAAKDAALARVCARARAAGPLAAPAARAFFETEFVAETMDGQGVLTAYYAPVYEARRAPDGEFSAPLRPKPANLKVVDAGLFDPAQAGRASAAFDPGSGPLLPYPDRSNIEAAAPDDALAWLRPEDLFFLQIQGSGALVFEDGRRMKALYAANNGRPFVGIANVMRDRGLLAAGDTSGEAIHGWLAANRGPEAQALMQLNPRYAFFRLAPDDGRPPVGAANIPLPAGRAVAIDRAHHPMGEVLWVDAEAPLLKGAFPAYRRLAVALDTGGAIQGPVRADLYLGEGAAAGKEAGRVRHTLRLYRLQPRDALP